MPFVILRPIYVHSVNAITISYQIRQTKPAGPGRPEEI